MSEKRLKRGDVVRFRFGIRQVDGLVEEDRGPIGVRGRRLYLVVFNAGPDSESRIELPADELERVELAMVSD